MKALTLHRPWDRFVASGQKRPENRPWAPPLKMLNETIAIHAGKFFDVEAAAWIQKLLRLPAMPQPHDHPEGIIGTARIAGWCDFTPATLPDPPGAVGWEGPREEVLGPMTGIEHTELNPTGHRDVPLIITEQDSQWMFGPVCWFLRDAVLLAKPVPCRGFQKLWNIPADVELKLTAALELTPVHSVLPCPGCGKLHVDRDEWAAQPHHTHRCEHCGREWRIELKPPNHSTYAVGIDIATELRLSRSAG